MLFCSISAEMASFLVRKYSEIDVQVTSILNVQPSIKFWHNVQPTVMIRHIQNPKDVEIQRSKNCCISTSFERSKKVTTKKERLPYVQKLRLYDVEIYVHMVFFNSLLRTDLNTTFIWRSLHVLCPVGKVV